MPPWGFFNLKRMNDSDFGIVCEAVLAAANVAADSDPLWETLRGGAHPPEDKAIPLLLRLIKWTARHPDVTPAAEV